jgi:hypothetical protein
MQNAEKQRSRLNVPPQTGYCHVERKPALSVSRVGRDISLYCNVRDSSTALRFARNDE